MIARIALLVVLLPAALIAADGLPRFTEEREAAALHFVRKHSPELVPLLDELSKSYRSQYERQISEIFQVTEMLADMRDDMARYNLELKIWKTENRAWLLVAKLANARPDERKPIEDSLLDLARELVALDVRNLEMQSEAVERELNSLRGELNRLRENVERSTRDRYDLLLAQVKKRTKKGN